VCLPCTRAMIPCHRAEKTAQLEHDCRGEAKRRTQGRVGWLMGLEPTTTGITTAKVK
jgi:hypothetical protein